MFDIREIRTDPVGFDEGLRRRGLAPMSAPVLALDEDRRKLQTDMQQAQSRRNDLSKRIGAAKRKGEGAGALMAEVAALKGEIKEYEERERALGGRIESILEKLPNRPADDVPEGEDESANVELRRWGEAPRFGFKPKQHFEIGEALGLMDFERAATLSGARFVVLRGALARLERALAQFMLDMHSAEFGYQETSPPALVRDEILYGTGQLPKFGEDLFQTTQGLWLIPTAEAPLTNMVYDAVLAEADLPLRYVAHTECFRSEAGAAGKDTRGMLRQHQFKKVELVSVTHPDKSCDELERMTGAAETVLRRLGLPYRVVVLSTGDMGFSACKTLDIEVWLPGQNAYREISSCSNCEAFQARRMRARFRPADGKTGALPVHTLNGSGVAIGRCLIAVLENGQQEDGSVILPEALRSYMGGLDRIGG